MNYVMQKRAQMVKKRTKNRKMLSNALRAMSIILTIAMQIATNRWLIKPSLMLEKRNATRPGGHWIHGVGTTDGYDVSNRRAPRSQISSAVRFRAFAHKDEHPSVCKTHAEFKFGFEFRF